MLTRQAALLRWGEAARRDLPWRRTRDPWDVLVSELMLQQTQVARVCPRYHDFLRRFPTPAACAAAPVGEVVRGWAGLGYNRRAVHLHRAARVIVECHEGAVPAQLPALLSLPGLGPYTARAVLAFAFEADVGVVDTNASRVLARAFAGRALRPTEAQQLADDVVPHRCGWSWNQAVLDLGATVCTKRAPRCPVCPIRARCTWGLAGRPEPDPARGSAGAGVPQAAFEGSDRQGRGRLVAALRRGPLALEEVAVTAGWPDDPLRALGVIDALVADGLAQRAEGALVLPGASGGG